MRRAHANHYVDCPCGQRVFGNGRTAHLRTCDKYLRQVGWPLPDSMAGVLRQEYPPGTVVAVQRRLGVFYADRRAAGNKTPLPWREHRDLVWGYAAEHEAAHRAEEKAARGG